MSEVTSGEYARALEAAWREVDILDGTLRPEFVKVRDGYYTEQIVLDEFVIAGPVPEGPQMPMQALAFHMEPCRIPRYRTDLVWRRDDSGGSGA